MKYSLLQDVHLGIGFFALALLIDRFLPASNLADFMQGALVGLSIVFNIRYGLMRFGKRTAH